MADHGDSATAERADYHAAPRLQPPLVCCIPLFYSAALLRILIANRFRLRQIVRLIHATTLAYATREGVARRARVSRQAGMAATPPKTVKSHLMPRLRPRRSALGAQIH